MPTEVPGRQRKAYRHYEWSRYWNGGDMSLFVSRSQSGVPRDRRPVQRNDVAPERGKAAANCPSRQKHSER
jgi:hypothetical protein